METLSTKQELSLWTSIQDEIKSFQATKTDSDTFLAKINKVHYKLELRKEKADAEFNVNAGVRMQGMYKEALEGITKEERKSGRFIVVFDQESRKKRKNEDLKASNAKRSKTDESQLLVGAQVAVKVDKDWILAVILNPNPVKGKVEIEDIEDDEDTPGIKKKYQVLPKHVIPIVKKDEFPEFPVKSQVLALYPASSCFYKATNTSAEHAGLYVVQFEDDNGFERHVNPMMILPFQN